MFADIKAVVRRRT